MPDARPPQQPDAIDIADAFAGLPEETPQDAWPAIAARLRRPATRRPARRAWIGMAAAAALALAVALPLYGPLRPAETAPQTPPEVARLESLMAESRSLEALVAAAQDDAAASGSVAALAAGYEDRLRLVDARLGDLAPGSDAEHLALWEERVHLLRDLAALEATRLWLATRGQDYQLVAVAVD
ncbi:hypothetical protein [Coralloluteibacterium thermophilus]|uniref:Uncharacterized protein n=1 Tax=Coralloluteibacterium thermophilum TaxID=2707049 RepID=A0ABV9NIX9_9GAMM